MVIQRQPQPLIIFPVDVLRRYAVLFHGDAIGDGAHELAEVAAYAFLFFDGVGVVGLTICEGNALVARVFAGNVAETAVDALALVDVGDVVVVDVEVFPMGEGGHAFANEIGGGGETFFVHPVAHAFAQVFDDAEAMLHSGGANLHARASEQHKFNGIFPRADAADTTDGHFACHFVLTDSSQKL